MYRIGQSQFRLEDDALLRGAGRFTGDCPEESEAAMVVVRSPAAAGKIAGLDVEAARAAPGVLAVLTAADTATLGCLAPRLRHQAPGGGEMFIPPYHPLAADAVRYVGDPVAVVVAETPAAAEDAAEMILVDIEPTPAVVDPAAALAEGAPAVWPQVPDNRAFVKTFGDRAVVAEAFRDAPHKVRQRLEISRVTAAPLEPRNAVARYDTATQRYSLRLGTQAPHRVAADLATVMGVEVQKIRVVAEDTGGGFGMKNAAYHEYALLLLAAERTGRPVRWTANRLESFLADSHAREQVVEAALALDGDGRFLAVEVTVLANLGAYLGPMGTHPMVNNIPGIAGVYQTPAIYVEVVGVHSHTQSMAPYRGAGRPEATYIMERLADLGARELGLDLAEIRRRNMIRAEQIPYRTALNYTYDSGDFPKVMETTLQAADWAGFAARREAAGRRGKLRGLGISNPIEIAGGPAGKPNPEFAAVDIAEDGSVTVKLGSCDSGQGHRTVFTQVLGEKLGVNGTELHILEGDTGEIAQGTGTFGSRSTGAIGASLIRVAEEIIAQAIPAAAEELEASPADLVFSEGRIMVVGSDRGIAIQELAQKQSRRFTAESFSSADNCSFPNGCHVCEVEVDPETGGLAIVGYWVVDDVGTEMNPLLVKGQIHGGIAQGLGQAVMERVVYDPESGQLLTASFMDYGMPRAADLPALQVASHPVPTAANPLGAKGVGEAGTVGALSAVVSAVCDALAPLGIRHLDMPATPERIWRAIQAAGQAAGAAR
jgi:carbon-monoxide dehydrogenase large subunit